MSLISTLEAKILAGEDITADEAYALCDAAPDCREELYAAAERITARFCEPVFDSCSIINARSGKCPEDCKWCAQSAHFKTKTDVYPLVSREECMRHADVNASQGIRRFSLVTSGRKMQGAELDRACSYFAEMSGKGNISLCASMGLLDESELQKLWDAGVRRYHCNLEAAPEFFSTLCSTHTVEDKIRTIGAARKIGFEICSGGIIGMGETPRQRVELALTLRRVRPDSIPVNILCPIDGTPLENRPPLPDEEVLDTVALFRFIHPRVVIRFAGGRASLPRETQLRAIRIGMNGGIVGDLLTTIGSTVAVDKELIADAGLTF